MNKNIRQRAANKAMGCGDVADFVEALLTETDTYVPASDSALRESIDMERKTALELRDEAYADLLDTCIHIYEKKSSAKSLQKWIFFICVMACFGGIVIAGGWIVIKIASKITIDKNGWAAIITSMAAIISAIVILPQIIAKHLFPENDEQFLIDMIKNMQINDQGIRQEKNGFRGQQKKD